MIVCGLSLSSSLASFIRSISGEKIKDKTTFKKLIEGEFSKIHSVDEKLARKIIDVFQELISRAYMQKMVG